MDRIQPHSTSTVVASNSNSASLQSGRTVRNVLLLLLTLGALLSGCAQPERVGVSFSTQVQPLFTEHCAACHSAAAAQGGLVLEAGSAYESLVGVPSGQVELMLVTAGDPQASYLIHKLEGTQGDVGGYGARMPLTGAPLTSEQMGLIRDWITQGAKDN